MSDEQTDEKLEERVLLYDAWTLIANAGLGNHRGGWDSEHPEWVEAAKRWRDRFHAYIDTKKEKE